MDTARRETAGWKVYPLAFYYLVVGNIALSIAVFGVIQLVLGYVIDTFYANPDSPGNTAIFAGFFGVWGGTLVVVGLGTYAALWANKKYGQLVLDEQT